MSQTFSYIEDSDLTDDCVNPTTDVWRDKVEPIQPVLFAPLCINRINQLPVRQMESRVAFEDEDILEQTVPEEIRTDELTSDLTTFMSEENVRIQYLFHASIHLTIEKLRGWPLYQTQFSPDFFNIKRYFQNIIKSSPVSQVEQKQISQKQDISVAINPEVLDEMEKNSATNDLKKIVKFAQEIYLNLKRIEISTEYDPEIADRKTIRFTLTVSGDPERILQNETQFKKQLRSNIKLNTRQLITVTYNWKN